MAIGNNHLISKAKIGERGSGWKNYLIPYAPLLAGRDGPDNINNKLKFLMEDWRFKDRRLVSISVLELAARKLDELLNHPNKKVIHFSELCLRSWVALQSSDFSGGLIISWSIIESLLRDIFDNSMTSISDGKLKKKIVKNRDLTSSVISDVLLGIGKMEKEIYEICTRVRQARNNWIHNLDAVEKSTAQQAIQLASLMLYNEKSIKLIVFPQEGSTLFYQP